MKRLILLLALVFPHSVCWAYLEATPEECAKFYGKPKFTKEVEGGVIFDYEPSIPGAKGLRVTATFKGNKAVTIRYSIAAQDKFTSDQFIMLSMLNDTHRESKFLEVGPSKDRSQMISATEDNSAYLITHQGKALMEVMTRAEAASVIKELPSAPKQLPFTPISPVMTPSPTGAGAASFTHFMLVKLPHKISVEIPRSWWRIGSELNEAIETSAEAMLDLSGLETPPDKETELITANSTPRNTYASVRITSSAVIGTPEEVAALNAKDLQYLSQEMQKGMRQMEKSGQNKLLEFFGCTIVKVGGSPAILSHYKRSGPHGNVLVWAYQIARPDAGLNLTLSYRESEAFLWKAVVERITKSVKFED